MPKDTRVPGEPAAEPKQAGEDGSASGASAADQIEAEIQRRVNAALEEALPAAVQAGVAKALRATKLAAQAGPAKIVMNMSLPSFDALTPEEKAAITQPTEFREGHYVPPGWPPTPEDARADHTVERLAQALAITKAG